MTAKDEIKALFDKNVKGHKADVTKMTVGHDGKEGHWLEAQFGVTHNADNKPDFKGFELKNETTSKTTFGDWSANVYIFSDSQTDKYFQGTTKLEKRDSFIKMFGHPNPKKPGRYSWSGAPVPKINQYNPFGQILKIGSNNDILAVYSFSKDQRPNKNCIIPQALQIDNLVIARWFGNSSPVPKAKCLKEKVEDKFNVNGWFTCKKGPDGTYQKLCFGSSITYEKWIELVAQGIVYFDSGMYTGNDRPYSQWRANNTYWDSLIYEEYE